MFYRNGSNFIDEYEYNDWCINETILILDNTEHLYNAYKKYIDNKMDRSLKRLVLNIMHDERMKVKQKNINKVIDELKNNYKCEQ